MWVSKCQLLSMCKSALTLLESQTARASTRAAVPAAHSAPASVKRSPGCHQHGLTFLDKECSGTFKLGFVPPFAAGHCGVREPYRCLGGICRPSTSASVERTPSFRKHGLTPLDKECPGTYQLGLVPLFTAGHRGIRVSYRCPGGICCTSDFSGPALTLPLFTFKPDL